MRRSRFLISFLLGFLVLATAGGARGDDTYSFSTEPTDGVVSGTPGSTVGWGYSLTNNSTTDYLATLDVYGDVVLDSLGTVDTSIFDLPIVAPMGTVTESYDPGNQLGLSQLFLDPGSTPGTGATGNFFIDAVFCANYDPTTGLLLNCSDTVVTDSAAVTVSVTSPNGTPIPEPSSMMLLLSGICGFGLWFAHRQRYSGWRAAQ